MNVKGVYLFVLLAFVAVQHNKGASIASNYLFSVSFPNLYSQVKTTMKTIQTLAINNTLNNAKKDLQKARSLIVTMQSKPKKNSASSMVNQTLQSIISTVIKVQKQATGRGVDTRSCTNKTMARMMGVGVDYAARVAACPVDEGTKAIKMINKDLAYVSELTNLTMYTPQAFSTCLSTGTLSTQAKCVASYLGDAGTKLMNAPGTLTSMVNEAYAYINVFPTDIAVCAANTSFASVANAATLALNITFCITEIVMNS